MPDTKFQDVEYPTDVIAGILGVTRARIRQLTKDGMPKNGRNRYPMIACIRWYIKFWKDKANQGDVALARYKKRLAKAQAESAEIDLKAKKKEMLPAADVEKDAFNMARQTRDAMLSIPDRISDQLAAEKKPEEVHKTLNIEITRALRGLAES